MKTIAMIALAAIAMTFGACASKSSSTTSASTTASTGYSK